MKKTVAYAIPGKLNLLVTVILSVLFFFILVTASRINFNWALLLIVPFALVQTTVYSLLHEAVDHLFHPSRKINDVAGIWLGLLFGGPFSFLRQSHLRHHAQNRGEYERFDLYYPGESKWKKIAGFYLVMLGGFWILIPLSSLLFIISPKILKSSFLKRNHYLEGKLASFSDKQMKRFRSESLFLIVFYVSITLIFDLHLLPTLILFLGHAISWSSQNYVGHAFSPRHVINGAHNHKTSWIGKLLFLNFNLHLAHHQHPDIPWTHLPRFVKEFSKPHNYTGAYIQLWKGPIIESDLQDLLNR